MTPEDKIVAALDRFRRAVIDCTAAILLIIIIIWFCTCALVTRAKASPLLSDGDEPTSLQYWYTVSVPQESGVYEVQVFTPALPALFAQPQIVVLDEALRLVETPEPGTFSYILGAIVLLAGAAKCVMLWKLYRCHCEIYEREIARKALEE